MKYNIILHTIAILVTMISLRVNDAHRRRFKMLLLFVYFVYYSDTGNVSI